jgi:hypothetical protein
MTLATRAGQPPVAGAETRIERCARRAAAVLNTHTNRNGLCAACPGVPFPCEWAVLAEHNVALLR